MTAGGMLTPMKSVTAVIGLSRIKAPCHIKGCEACEKDRLHIPEIFIDETRTDREDKSAKGADMMILERLGKELLYFDGGMGTLLQSKGLKPGQLPEVWNIEHADEVVDIHRQYFEAGSDIVLANTFGANALKVPRCLL